MGSSIRFGRPGRPTLLPDASFPEIIEMEHLETFPTPPRGYRFVNWGTEKISCRTTRA